ncbi:MAG: class I SAM-dependent methyltransferase [Candidatus Chloroheliales bacterium]|nr:MAG: class I SAM-dependent methyltransferase [Chloroflexota bacterium]
MTDIEQQQQRYYNQRAGEYELMYSLNDERFLSDIVASEQTVRAVMQGRQVLEVACGTGHWSEVVADVAQQVVATDASAEVLAVARAMNRETGNVEFRLADAYALHEVAGDFDAGLAMFWVSHVPKARLGEFLDGFHRRLGSGAVVFMADEVDVPGAGVVEGKPGTADTFQARELNDGSRYEIIKNFYDERQLRQLLADRATDLKIGTLNHLWWVSYTVRLGIGQPLGN